MLAYQGEAEAAGAIVVLRTPVLGGRCAMTVSSLRSAATSRRRSAAGLWSTPPGFMRPLWRTAIEGIPPRDDPAGIFLPRRLFHAERARAVSPAHLPRPGAGRARRAHHAGSGRSGAVRARCRMDLLGRLLGRSGARRGRSMRAVRTLLARVARTARCSRAMPASGRRSAGRPSRPPISSCRVRETHGVPGLVNLYGIDSPGLTASLPLADEVARKLR